MYRVILVHRCDHYRAEIYISIYCRNIETLGTNSTFKNMKKCSQNVLHVDRDAGVGMRQVAKEFNVSHMTILRVVHDQLQFTSTESHALRFSSARGLLSAFCSTKC
jgi:hypothetical protein